MQAGVQRGVEHCFHLGGRAPRIRAGRQVHLQHAQGRSEEKPTDPGSAAEGTLRAARGSPARRARRPRRPPCAGNPPQNFDRREEDVQPADARLQQSAVRTASGFGSASAGPAHAAWPDLERFFPRRPAARCAASHAPRAPRTLRSARSAARTVSSSARAPPEQAEGRRVGAAARWVSRRRGDRGGRAGRSNARCGNLSRPRQGSTNPAGVAEPRF